MSVDIFFDMRAVHGDARLANGLWRESFELAAGQTAFAKLLAAEAAGTTEPGLNLFGDSAPDGADRSRRNQGCSAS